MEGEKREKKKIMETRIWKCIIAVFGSIWAFGWFIAALVATPWFIRWPIDAIMGYEVSILKIYLFSVLPMVSIWSLIVKASQDRLARKNQAGNPLENAIKKLKEWQDEEACAENNCSGNGTDPRCAKESTAVLLMRGYEENTTGLHGQKKAQDSMG